MDKKLAQAEALRKAKEQQYTAGKNTGMSGRDLVRCHFPITIFLLFIICDYSSNSTRSGSKTKKRKTTGIFHSTDAHRKRSMPSCDNRSDSSVT